MVRERLSEKLKRRLAKAVVTRSIVLAPGGPRVGFTFDDVAVSAATSGARLLEDRGVRGTFYVCGGLAGRAWDAYPLAGLDTVADLARRGHEIGCHTATHLRGTAVGSAAYLHDVDDNARILEPVVGRLETFAYPFGAIGLPHKLVLQRRFGACRGIHGGAMTAVADRGRLEAVALEDASIGEAEIDALLDDAVARRAWLVFYAHDVSAEPTRYGVTPKRFAYAVDGAIARGCRVEPIRDTLRALHRSTG